MTDGQADLPQGALDPLNLQTLALGPVRMGGCPSAFSRNPKTSSRRTRAPLVPPSTAWSTGAGVKGRRFMEAMELILERSERDDSPAHPPVDSLLHLP